MTTHAELFLFLDIHCRDAANAMTLPRIAEALGTSTRDIQEIIEECAGIDGVSVVCSSTGRKPGLFITRDPAQMQPFLQQLRNRERNTRKRRLAIEKKHPQLREERLGRPPLTVVSNGSSLRAQTTMEASW